MEKTNFNNLIKNKKANLVFRPDWLSKKRQLPTLPQHAVPSAPSGLTSLFGMGRGGTPTL